MVCFVIKRGSIVVCKYCSINSFGGEIVYQNFSGVVLSKSFSKGKLRFLKVRNKFFRVKVDLRIDLWFPTIVGVSFLFTPALSLKGDLFLDK